MVKDVVWARELARLMDKELPLSHALELAEHKTFAYLAVIVDNYLRERTLWYDTDDRPKQHVVRACIPCRYHY